MVRAMEDVEVIELAVDWTKPLVDVQILHRKWAADANYSTFYPMFSGFKL